jgi:hypothetical protein
MAKRNTRGAFLDRERAKEQGCELGPGIRRAHFDDADGFDPRPRRLSALGWKVRDGLMKAYNDFLTNAV